MTQIELMSDVLAKDPGFLGMTLGDFSDADMLVRPAPAANHAAWQIGHLIVAETGMVNSVTPGAVPELPVGFADRFKKETAKNNDPSAFPKKSELLELFGKMRGATVKWARGLTPPDLDKQTPEKMRSWCPTVGHLVALLPQHVAMHVGQFQVIRRKLEKPVLF